MRSRIRRALLGATDVKPPRSADHWSARFGTAQGRRALLGATDVKPPRSADHWSARFGTVQGCRPLIGVVRDRAGTPSTARRYGKGMLVAPTIGRRQELTGPFSYSAVCTPGSHASDRKHRIRTTALSVPPDVHEKPRCPVRAWRLRPDAAVQFRSPDA